MRRKSTHELRSAGWRRTLGNGKIFYRSRSAPQPATLIIEPMAKNSFGAAAKLRVGNAEYDYFRLARLAEQGVGNVGQLPFSIRILLENLLRNEDGKRVSAGGRRGGGAAATAPASKRSASCPRACCCRTSPACPAWSIWRPCATRWPRWARPEPANPLMPVDLVIDHSVQVDQFGTDGRLRPQCAARIPAQSRALHSAALGPDGVPQFPRGAAGYRHRAPGESGIPGAGGLPQSGGHGLSGYGGRHRFAHHDDQRPGRGGLGRRRHRSRGLHARASRSPCCCRRWSASS